MSASGSALGGTNSVSGLLGSATVVSATYEAGDQKIIFTGAAGNFGNVDFSLRRCEIRLVLLSETIAVRQGQRLVLGGGRKADKRQSEDRQRDMSPTVIVVSHQVDALNLFKML